MEKNFFVLLSLIKILLITTKTIITKDLQNSLSQAEPGDIIELSSGTYSQSPYKFSKSGAPDNPIIIKPQSGASIKFTGSNEGCIFELNGISYVNIQGNMELSNAKCGIKVSDSNNIIIKGLNIHNINQEAIIASGDNIDVSENEIYNCVSDSKNQGKNLNKGINQCITTLRKNQNKDFSTNITFSNNNIHDGYGEGIKFSYCDGCSAIGNTIINTLSMNIYLYSSKNLLIERNIIKVTNQNYNSIYGKAVGIGLSSDSENDIENIEIQNNIIVGCRIGIYFFITGTGTYKSVKIYHNTIWMVDITPIWFAEPINNPSKSELYNNLIYHNKQSQLYPKSVWVIGYNFFYNSDKVPTQYSDSGNDKGTSRATTEIDLSKIFNSQNGKCDYNNANINITCFRPNSSPDNDNINLSHRGKKIREQGKDLEGCKRDTQPSIGAFEFSNGCKTEPEPTDPPESDTDIPDIEYDVKFVINYQTKNSQIIKMVGTFCKWNKNPQDCFSLNNIGNWNWAYTLKDGISQTFYYKFVTANGNTLDRWESDPNRYFNGKKLLELTKTSKSGIYNDCYYQLKENLITLNCYWR